MRIEEISISDYRVLETEFEQLELKIVTEGSYDVKAGKSNGTTEITIKNWSEIFFKLFVSDDSFRGLNGVELNSENVETFEFIQEIVIDDKTLQLKGFSIESGAWLEYHIVKPQVDVRSR